ncbi:MAG: 2-C-methyl-D-erythritol 2,4-cyclodiphosphate synthase, partial [Synergistota bacterium]|nr:2-C-methyl-D-erythritol 2,4-cyclodiphosphate synthase [Synergistota bacterium]
MKDVSFVVVAGGKGERTGGSVPKQFRPLAGFPLWRWSVNTAERLFLRGLVKECVLVLPAGDLDSTGREVRSFKVPVVVTAGGAERQESVLRGIDAASGEYVLIHDGARPFLSVSLAERLVAALDREHGVLPLLPVSDALKLSDEDGALSPFPRENLWITQTPQGFPRKALISVLRSHSGGAKDEGEAWSDSGLPLRSVKGERTNIKITWEEDFAMAEGIAQRAFRTGIGYDIHPLVPGRRYILGGVEFPDFPLGFSGHSDGDVLVHAVCDALLGAAGLGDIGMLYPASDDKYKDMASTILLKDVVDRVEGEGWSLEWIDCVISAQLPRLAPSLPRMIETMEGFFPASWRGRLHLKAKSGEGIGDVGYSRSVVCR